MLFRSIRWRIAVNYLLLVLGTMLVLNVYLSGLVRDARLADLRTQLTTGARAIASSPELESALAAPGNALDPLMQRWSDLLGARVTIIRADGVVLGESHADYALMERHDDRPEVQEALTTGQGYSIRRSRTLGYDLSYVAVPIRQGGVNIGVVRLSVPIRQVEASITHLQQTILTVTLLAAILTMFLAILIAERTVRPVRQLTEVAGQMAEGDLRVRLLPMTRDEVGQLTRAFNRMADQLQEQITSLAGERRRLNAVLEYMADGIIITDDAGYVSLINPAAVRLLPTAEVAPLGRSFVEVVRNYQLIALWQRCRDTGQEQSATVELDRPRLFLRMTVTPFRGSDPQSCLVILQDLTQVRRLETVRRDFISNLSHELRTPLASLRALVDTLRDGALEDPPAAQRFLDRIETEVDALTQMVRELLELSRIESGQVPLSLTPTPVAELLVRPVDRLRPQAERAGLSLELTLPPDLPLAMADAERIHQVVTNLVHNAIKFTPPGGQITITAVCNDPAEIVVRVSDTGVGIPADDLPRIFERFYKADRARSGGGTGLGLSIARHIVQAHNGRIWAESREGYGAHFFFTLPVASLQTFTPS